MANASDDDDFDSIVDDDIDVIGADEEENEAPSSVAMPSRLVAVRRAIEARDEQRQMEAALDYLELDFDDDE